MVLITIMERLPPSLLSPFFPHISSLSPLSCLRIPSRARAEPLTPANPSALCSVPRRWRQLSGYLKRKILISPLKRVRFKARVWFLLWSFNGIAEADDGIAGGNFFSRHRWNAASSSSSSEVRGRKEFVLRRECRSFGVRSIEILPRE